jgi:hypothetical protein
MTTKTVNIIIRQMEENGEIYYLAESPDLFGLVVEADTLPEIIELVPEVANDLIDSNNQTSTPHGKANTFELRNNVSYQMTFKPLKVYSLQYLLYHKF